jgi:hypothetical protein
MSLTNRSRFIPISRSEMETVPSQCVFIGGLILSDASLFFSLLEYSPQYQSNVLITRKEKSVKEGDISAMFLHRFANLFSIIPTLFRDPDTQIISQTIRAFRSKTQKLSRTCGGGHYPTTSINTFVPRHYGGGLLHPGALNVFPIRVIKKRFFPT